MEAAVFFVLLLVGLAVLVAPFIAINALLRTRSLERKLERLPAIERELARIAREVAERPAAASAPEPRPAPPPPVERPKTVPPWVARPPAPPAAAIEPTLSIESEPPIEPAPPASAAVPAPSIPASPAIDWERWLGIRGAAVLGAIALGLAGLLFFKYSIDRGLLTPALRVILGTLVGLACLVVSESPRARRYRHASDGVAAAGIVILYAAFWAAAELYSLIGLALAFVLMALVTAVCALLALRRDALVIAVIGLVGGFATPLLLASGEDRPIGLFGYVLLLDLGLLALGRRRGWPSLALLSLLGTVVLEGVWVVAGPGARHPLLGLTILAVFALLFATAGRLTAAASAPWLWTRAGAIFFPFAFALYFAARVDLGPRLWPLGLLLALLSVAAGYLSRERAQHALGLAAAAASVAVVGVWSLAHTLTSPLAWQLVLVSLALALVFHAFIGRDDEDMDSESPAAAALVAAVGFFCLFLITARMAESVPPWPWLAGFAALAGIGYRHATLTRRAVLQPAAAVAFGVGFGVLGLRGPSAALPPAILWLALAVFAALAAHIVAGRREDPLLRRFAEHAAGALPLTLLLALAIAPRTPETGPFLVLGVALLLGISAAAAAARAGSGSWSAAAVAGTFLLSTVWTAFRTDLAKAPGEAALALALVFVATLFHTAWPFLAMGRLAAEPRAWHAAALAGPLAFLSAKRLYEIAFGDAAIGLLPLAFGALSLAAVLRARRVLPAEEPQRLTALVWFSAVALGFLSISIPLQLEKEWITIGWALEGLAVIALWRRLDHPGLKYFGVALLGTAGLRLTLNPAVLGYYTRSTWRIVNWLAYAYLVPAAAMALGAALLRPLELARLRPSERQYYRGERPLGTIVAFGAAVIVVFVWINLTIADWFAKGPFLTLSFGDTPAQRLTVSIAWAVYAVALLGLGMRRDSLGLRWVSLGFLLVTIAKVFLYDLGALRDLYRVASLVGLAVSLILVSLLYQRFVFRRGSAGES